MRKTIIIMMLIISLLAVSVSAVDDETYYIENTSFFTLNTSTGENFLIYDSWDGGAYKSQLGCNRVTIIDWNDDGYLDIVAKTNISGYDNYWSIYLNSGDYTSWIEFYNFSNSSVPASGEEYHLPLNYGKANGGWCNTFADLDNDGDLDLFSYSYGQPVTYRNSSSKYYENSIVGGNRGFYENTGTNNAPVFVLNNNDLGDTAPTLDGNNAWSTQPIPTSYVVGELPSATPLILDACDECNNNYCYLLAEPFCYGTSVYPSARHQEFIFQDIDYDRDYDLIIYYGSSKTSASGYASVWENQGSKVAPYWVENTEDFFVNSSYTLDCLNGGGYIYDIDGDGDLDLFGPDAYNALVGEIQFRMCDNLGWAEIQEEVALYNYTTEFPFYGNDYEPTIYGTRGSISYMGDIDGDLDVDMIIAYNNGVLGSGFKLALYESQDYGNSEPYYYYAEAESCDLPCILDEDFSDMPDGMPVNQLDGWWADSCVTIEDNELLIEGSCSTNRVCYKMPYQLSINGSIDFSIKANETCTFSALQKFYSPTAVFNSWDNLSGLYMYNYLGESLGRYLIDYFYPTIYYDYNSIVDVSAGDYYLEYGDYAGTQDFYDDVEYIGALCWSASDTDSVCHIDDISVYFGMTAGAGVTPNLTCFAGYCWDSDGGLMDVSDSDSYESQTSYMGETFFFNYDLCTEAGYSKNIWCILKLLRDDTLDSIKTWFFNNVLLVFLLGLLGSLAVIIFARTRSRS